MILEFSLAPELNTRAEQVLETGGFKIEHISLSPRITPLPGSYTDFLRTFVRGTALKMMSDEEAETAMQEMSDLCEPDMKDENGGWAIVFVGLRFLAVAE